MTRTRRESRIAGLVGFGGILCWLLTLDGGFLRSDGAGLAFLLGFTGQELEEIGNATDNAAMYQDNIF